MKITFFRTLSLLLAVLPLPMLAAEPAKSSVAKQDPSPASLEKQLAEKAAAVQEAQLNGWPGKSESIQVVPAGSLEFSPAKLYGSVQPPRPDEPTPGRPKSDRPSEPPRPRAGRPSQPGMTPVNEYHGYDQPAMGGILQAHRERTVASGTIFMADRARRVEEAIDGTATPSGRFQVILLGFDVNRQTRDDALENDGRGDEVFLHTAVHHRRSDRVSASFRNTAVMGDQNRHWLRAGSAGAEGGLRSGDRVGTRRLPTDFSPEGFRWFHLPLLAFDGELMAGRDALLVAPSVWEWDDWGHAPGTGSELRFGDFHSDAWHEENRAGSYQADFRYASRRDRLARLLADVLDDRVEDTSLPRILSGRGVYPGAEGDMGGNRPIGMSRSEDILHWTPQVLALNYATADQISRTEFDGARGVVTIRYADEGDLDGDYTLYLQVRRVE